MGLMTGEQYVESLRELLQYLQVKRLIDLQTFIRAQQT